MPNFRLAVLLCDDLPIPLPDDPVKYINYDKIYHQFLAESLAEITWDTTFTLDCFDVVNDVAYLSEGVHYDGIVIGGSRASVNDDLPWVKKLLAYTKHIITEKPSVKVFGICFGYQIICKALGGTVASKEEDGEMSVTTINLTGLGKAIFRAPELRLQQCHHDQVIEHPPHAHLLGSSDNTQNQGIVMFDPAAVPLPADLDSNAWRVDLTSIHVLALQAHPEFTEHIMRTVIEYVTDYLPRPFLDDAITRVELPTDGINRVGRVIWEVLGVTSKFYSKL